MAADAAHPPPGLASTGTVLRPVIFVVDATHPPSTPRGSQSVDDGEEPFDVRRTSLASAGDLDSLDDNLFDRFLGALRGKNPDDVRGSNVDEEISLAASYASSAPPFTPREGDETVVDTTSPSPSPTHRRFMSPFSKLRVGRWKASSPAGASLDDDTTAATSASTAHHALARDMEDDHHDDASSSIQSDAVSSALSSYSKDNPPVHFMSKRARIVSVSRRHAFPPSKFPRGKMDPNAAGVGVTGVGTTMMLGEQQGSSHGGNSWMSSYEIQEEGILPSGWLEKHARALPSALVVVATLKVTNEDSRRLSMKNATRAVEDLRVTLAEKRSVPIHLVCLMREDEVDKEGVKLRNLNAMREKLCQETYLPQSQVFLMKCPGDLVPDEFECGIMKSPYLDPNAVGALGNVPGAPTTPGAVSAAAGSAGNVMMNPILRQLDRSLRDSSALYYSRLADAQERKLHLWRNRYHGTNASFEVNTLMAAMRCARYAMKVGTLREFQSRTGGNVAIGAGNARWTDKSSSAMRHYDEAYRWVVELHRRAISWRATALSATTSGSSLGSSGHGAFPSPAPPITPGGQNVYSDISSPKLTESPGGGMGVELSLPGPPAPTLSGATPPPPPMRRNSPALTSRKGYNTPENIAFFAGLWEQCRAVSSLLNAKILRSENPQNANNGSGSFGVEAEEQWSRHRLTFLSIPRSVPNFVASTDDEFFGPSWHRFLYIAEELLTYSCITEGRWRRALSAHASGKSTQVWSASYHQAGAPWGAYGELCEAMLGLRRTVKLQIAEPGGNEWLTSTSSSGRRKFVGSIISGDGGLGTLSWKYESESTKDHRAMALDYVLHALDLLDENISLCAGGTTDGTGDTSATPPQQPNSSARLHYLAARLLMGLDDPNGAMVHLKIASGQTKTWPSLNLSIQRALFACEERCAAKGQKGASSAMSGTPPTLPNLSIESKDSCIELLLKSKSCRLLSPEEKEDALSKAWSSDGDLEADTREVVWTHDDTKKGSDPPFEYAVSFLESTHATSGDAVKACVSIRSNLDFEACVESMQLVTTAGTYDVPNLEKCGSDKEGMVHSCLHKEGGVGKPPSLESRNVPGFGVRFDLNDLAFFLAELALPTNLSDITLGGDVVDTSKFIPKNARLCNMGFSHAAGNICEPRFDNGTAQQKININGKPIVLSSVSEQSSLFIGGIPLVCHGIILTLKRANSESSSSVKLHIEQPRLISPLLRSGNQRLLMEESNYMAHSWSRPNHHPWCLGPRILRVQGPRPKMHVTNLTESMTESRAVDGTVNRIMFRIEAGEDEDCRDVRVRIRCNSTKGSPAQQAGNDPAVEVAGSADVDPRGMPTFVRKSADPTAKAVTKTGLALPVGWESRKDVGTDESHDETTVISNHLGAGKSLLYPLDVYRPLDQSSLTSEGDAIKTTCTTTYDVIIMYRQLRSANKSANKSTIEGDEVMVTQSGSIEWIPPFSAKFAQTDGPRRSFPSGIQHASNEASSSSSVETSSSSVGTELVAANGEWVRMRCSLEASGLGPNNAASIIRVSNESETNEKRRELYSSDSGLFMMSQTKRGSKLSLSYSVLAQRDVEGGHEREMIPLGVISVDWKPSSLPLPDNALAPTDMADEFGPSHGPLALPSLTPVIFYGPQCQVLPSPFSAKLLKCPSAPKVGFPFLISYQVINRTAKNQTLVLSLNDAQDGDVASLPDDSPRLLGTGKLKEETEMAPFEEKVFSFTFLSMASGKVCRPRLTVSSGRHQTWVINETPNSYLFVMP